MAMRGILPDSFGSAMGFLPSFGDGNLYREQQNCEELELH
jgi:hypothetical protein